jgi:glycosyltransferase involved in cell wall biosynthesis
MAVYDGERYVAEALESALAQDWRPLEVIVVDDGSRDRTPQIVRSFAGVRYVRRENGGPAAARNTGVSLAAGSFVGFVDADDVLLPEKVSAQARHLVEHPRVGCVLGRQEWIDPPPWFTRDAVYGELDGIPLVSALFRREALVGVGGFDERFASGEDMDLLMRLREHGHEIAVLPDVVLRRRYHGDSLSATRPRHEPMLRSLRAKLERERGVA